MKFQLIDNWATVLWHSATSRTTAVMGAIIGTIGVHWAMILGIVPWLPVYLQVPAIALVALAVAGPTLLSRITCQPKLQQKIAEKTDAKA